MSRRWWMTVALVLAASACGEGKTGKDAGTPEPDAAEPDGSDAGGESTGGATGGKKWIQIRNAPNCADDDLTTPGSECVNIASCGGNAATPHACPLDTHTCCGSGEPSQEHANCYEGTNACPGLGAPVPCDGPEDCQNDNICCVTPPGKVAPMTECRPLADCDQKTEGSIFCHSDADCPEGTSCASNAKSPFWGFCG